MTLPKANYVVDAQGKTVFAQTPLRDREKLLAKYERIEAQLLFPSKLKDAFQEARQITRGGKEGTLFQDFLNEL